MTFFIKYINNKKGTGKTNFRTFAISQFRREKNTHARVDAFLSSFTLHSYHNIKKSERLSTLLPAVDKLRCLHKETSCVFVMSSSDSGVMGGCVAVVVEVVVVVVDVVFDPNYTKLLKEDRQRKGRRGENTRSP